MKTLREDKLKNILQEQSNSKVLEELALELNVISEGLKGKLYRPKKIKKSLNFTTP